jgi:dTDP-4-dehydrorhamnose 3,5-epimerase-like enzyme
MVDLPKDHNNAGNLTALENNTSLPFQVKRVYYLYDVPGGESRGGHAHKQLHQYVVAVAGAFDVMVDDGEEKKMIRLDRPHKALHIVPGIWRELHNFSSGSICLVLASLPYSEEDYIRKYSSFVKIKHSDS